MQVQKDNIKQDIITAAREEFLEKGFTGASMRTIAQKSGISLSNIYNYFTNKDDILQEVLNPLLMAIDLILGEHNDSEYINLEIFTSPDYQIENINLHVGLITQFRRELYLLLFRSHGSSLEDFRDDYTNRHTQMGLDYLDKMRKKYPSINVDISEFFLHTMSSWWLSIIGEIVSHELSAVDVERFISEYMVFGTAGWKSILKV